jgi:hypothetical protein
MFRQTSTILDDGEYTTAEAMKTSALDADVIMTAAMLGFTAARFAVGHPVEFAIDPGDDPDAKMAELKAATKRINASLGDYGYDGLVDAVFAPDWEKASMITGAVGSAAKPFAQRRATETEETASELRRLAAASGKDAIGYQGRGAYTGFVDDPVTRRPGIKSTMRYNVPDHDYYGERWLPPTYEYRNKKGEIIGTHEDLAWGLIGGVPSVGDDMVQEPYDLSKGALVGYTHGMIQAIYDAVQKGPWCTPFEIAVGNDTRKLASCFTCTLLMYAAGFPPSAIHIGRGESWVPFYEIPRGVTPTGKHSPITDLAINTVNNRWRIECKQHLELGVKVMMQEEMSFVSETHHERLVLLDKWLRARANDMSAGANLILDAVTVHDSETARVTRTLVG